MSPEPRVVAELGRPETPEETAARKAENSRNHRTRQTANNLVLSLLATVGLVIFIVLIVPRGDQNYDPQVDFTAAAAQVQPSVAEPLAVPAVPAGWKANLAQLQTDSDGTKSWNVGLITSSETFIAISQGLNAPDGWLSTKLLDIPATGNETIDGVNWTVHDNREASNGQGNKQYALSTSAAGSTLILYGTADDSDFHTVATAVTEQFEAAQ